MSLAAYAVRRTLGALAVLLLVIALVQFAVNLALTRTLHGDADFFAIFEQDRATWMDFARLVAVAAGVTAIAVVAWRLAGTRRKRTARPDEVR